MRSDRLRRCGSVPLGLKELGRSGSQPLQQQQQQPQHLQPTQRQRQPRHLENLEPQNLHLWNELKVSSSMGSPHDPLRCDNEDLALRTGRATRRHLPLSVELIPQLPEFGAKIANPSSSRRRPAQLPSLNAQVRANSLSALKRARGDNAPDDELAALRPHSPAGSEDSLETKSRISTPSSDGSSARRCSSIMTGSILSPSDKHRSRATAWGRSSSNASTRSPSITSASHVSSTSQACRAQVSNIGSALSWKRGKKIGAGSYGNVYTAMSRETGEIFAVKESVVMKDGAEEQRYYDKLEYELSICQSLRHPNIVSYLGHDWVDHNLYIRLEYVAGGCMAKILKEFGKLPESRLSKASLGLFRGLDHLHTRSPPVVHRDIKAANLLVSLNFDVKLADFGVSRQNSNTKSLTMVGSIPWMAPEVIQQQDGHGRKADIWSAGCTMIEMATGEKPWGDDAFDNIMFALSRISMSDATPPIAGDVSPECHDFIAQCVQRCPESRPWCCEVLEHTFLTKCANSSPI